MSKGRSRKSRPAAFESRALATELGALLERLEIPAVLTDRAGTTLAATRHADSLAASNADLVRKVVEMRLYGQAICVAVPTSAPSDGAEELTPRQRAVLELIREGLPNKEIGERLGISLHTVRRHVEALLVRLNVRTRAAAALTTRGRVQHAEHAGHAGDGDARPRRAV